MGGAIYNAKGMGEPTYGLLLALVLSFEACSACSASKVSHWMLGAVVRRLTESILFCVMVVVSGL